MAFISFMIIFELKGFVSGAWEFKKNMLSGQNLQPYFPSFYWTFGEEKNIFYIIRCLCLYENCNHFCYVKYMNFLRQ